jgi:hypothetical protein
MAIAVVLVYLVVAALVFVVLYWVIRAAVLHALREHTKTSVTAVVVREVGARASASTDA